MVVSSAGTASSSEQQQHEDGRAQAVAAGQHAVAGFGDVVSCGDKFEVSRMFAAMLQLINNRSGGVIRVQSLNPKPYPSHPV